MEDQKGKFRLYQENGETLIERMVYPRFTGRVTFGTLSDIEDVEMKDPLRGVMDMATAMREAGEYLIQVSRNKNRKSNE